jgi:RNA polymerase sigma-70 factor (ECF subfamily)
MTQPLTTFEDNTLIKMALNGQSECFSILTERHFSFVRRRLTQMVDNTADADDLMQEVLFKVWRFLSEFRFESSFRTWMTRIAINEALQLYRRKKHHSCCQQVADLDDLVSTADSPHQWLTRADTSQTVRNALARLPEKYRQVIICHEFDQLSLRETAKSLSASVPAVKSRLFRAKLLLSHSLKRSDRRVLAAQQVAVI